MNCTSKIKLKMTQTTKKMTTKTKPIADLVEYTETQSRILMAQKLLKVKMEVGAISKDSTNPFFKSKYFDINDLLSHVEPILHKYGLVCLQPLIDGCVTTELLDTETGAIMTSGIQLSDNKDPQKLGSEITYFRRYTLASLLALQSEDDDGDRATKQNIVVVPKAEIPKLNAEQFKLAMESDAKGIEATIKAIQSGKIIAHSNQTNQLIIKLEQLKK